MKTGPNGEICGIEDYVTTKDVLSLDSIRSTLIRQEETIIFAFIERTQFRRNDKVYEVGGIGDFGAPPGSTSTGGVLSFMDFMLVGTETLHSAVRRYTSPEEHAFFPDRLPRVAAPALSELEYPDLLSPEGGASSVNFNEILRKKYIEVIMPAVAQCGDDEQYGSTVLADVAALQALSKRIHYGKFVAESKYQSDPEGYQKLVDAGDAEGVMKLLTNEKVEEQVLRRARLKAATYGREPLIPNLSNIATGGEDTDATSFIAAAAASAVFAATEAVRGGKDDYGDETQQTMGKVDPGIIENIYRDLIIPMTKDVEVAYLFLRCGRNPPSEYSPERMSIDVTSVKAGS